MIDPDIELRLRAYNRGKAIPLTYEQYALMLCKQVAYKMSKNNIILISSYDISDDRFEEVYSFDKARSTLQGGKGNGKCEKLFMIK